MTFSLSNSWQSATNSFLTPVLPAALLATSKSDLSTSALGSLDKMVDVAEGVEPFSAW